MKFRHYLQTLILIAAAVTVAACANSDGPGGTTPTPVGDVATFMAELPAWDEFSPLGAAQPPAATGETTDLGVEELDVEVVREDGTTEILPDVQYVCRETPYRLTENPEEIVMFSPDREILWPGAFIQGNSYANGLGGLRPLVINERAPINVSIPGLATGQNFRLVSSPQQATVESAIGEIIGDATRDTLDRASSITFSMDTYHSESSWALSVKASGRYLGFSGSAQGDRSRNASETTVTAKFVQKMYEVVVAPPQTPSAFFSAAFTAQKLQEQVDLGRIGSDNIPVYVSEVVYGRMMMFSVTSTASAEDIRGSISAAYNGLGAGGSGSLSAKQQTILQKSKIAITSIGGPAEATQDVIRSGNLNDFFTRTAALSTAVPLSYTFRNLSDGTIAQVTESTDYVIRECTAQGAGGEPFVFLPEQIVPVGVTTPARAVTGDFNHDGFTDIAWNHTGPTGNEVLLGLCDGNGGFDYFGPISHPETPGEGWTAYDTSVGDLDGDGDDDLVWNARGASNVTYLGFSDGLGGLTFGGRQRQPVGGWGAYRVFVGDVNGDRIDDLVWNVTSSTNRTYVGLGSATGELTFLTAQDHPNGGWTPYTTHIGDVNGDGRLDLIWNVTTTTGNRTYAATGGSDGRFSFRAAFDRPGNGWSDYTAVVGDANGDSRTDVVWAATARSSVPVHLSYATASGFANGPLVFKDTERDGPHQLRLLDLDGDGRQDLVMNRLTNLVNAVYVGLSTQSSGFLFTPLDMEHPAGVTWDQYQLLSGDFNGDGRQDLAWNHAAVTNRIFVALSVVN